MKSWPAPAVPTVPGTPLPVRIHDTARGEVVALTPGPTARIYCCGITPYDATHMGHAATYVTFDLLGRALRQAGHEVAYTQNITDVDDPLLERAARDGVDWTALATKEIQLFRDDMTALRVLPPTDYVGVVESVDRVADQVQQLVRAGAAYPVEITGPDAGLVADGARDYYLDLSRQASFGEVSGWTREQMLEVFADRGGDPDRPGKRDALDPLLWRAERRGEPAWQGGELGCGRPGWHIECTTIALGTLGMGFDVQGGGTDLVFPHHEMSAVQAVGLTGEPAFASAYLHQAMVGLDGEKMSKSKGNLVLVSRLREQGVDPMAVRLVLLDQHYRTEWSWTDALLARAQERLTRWRAGVARETTPPADEVVGQVRAALCQDLDTPAALAAVDAWCAAAGAHAGQGETVGDALDALLGIRL
ncbi:cysteine--1-D-myo-inosityl 2-amino-2-deoxy-alpha-D-glucopyranoside ligase [Arsenicicoccus dermatophilus]|uniref:cysteine--1-D-myo-inosityl 2-amino-2-deoxy-alpha-D-glucopyranoside ligase n=1 Tax=Arsenicicoccus dermatophilus TaxID=1076331 RepID=UPI001F4D26A3|nr:cysteine--1-D-myo-inosityl 2-amino-2-deoxy-alpha-D-glucopyranoside ligase [Arsenicicoccus dermatophilus]